MKQIEGGRERGARIGFRQKAADILRLPSVGVSSESRSQSHFSGALPGRIPRLERFRRPYRVGNPVSTFRSSVSRRFPCFKASKRLRSGRAVKKQIANSYQSVKGNSHPFVAHGSARPLLHLECRPSPDDYPERSGRFFTNQKKSGRASARPLRVMDESRRQSPIGWRGRTSSVRSSAP